jgi:nucleoside-diphosphate-sugar epimerase
MKVLVLGGAGFIGSILCSYLRERGDEVNVLDAFLFEENREPRVSSNGFVRGDIRNLRDLLPSIEDADAVVNLAAISNDPASDLLPEVTWEVNYRANEIIADLCQATDKRVVYASSCSVYGFSEGGTFDERSKLGPVTLYARTKMLSERCYLRGDIDAVVLRFATVYGYSPKVRFDLVVNTMIGSGFFGGKIVVNGGDQWRPLVHVRDVAKSIYLALHAEDPEQRVYNVGSNEQNYQIGALGALIAGQMPGVELVNVGNNPDKRSYKVDFGLIGEELGFETVHTVADAVDEFCEVFNKGEVSSMHEDVYYRVKYLKNLYESMYVEKEPAVGAAALPHYGTFGTGANGGATRSAGLDTAVAYGVSATTNREVASNA